jgi:hypothetical protein
MQYNHGALGLGVVQKDQIVKFLQIRFILCLSFKKGLVSVTLTEMDDPQAKQMRVSLSKYAMQRIDRTSRS